MKNQHNIAHSPTYIIPPPNHLFICSSSPGTRRHSRFRASRDEPPILQALDDEKTPVLAVRVTDDMCSVMLVDQLCRSRAVLVHHAVNSVSYIPDVQSTFVRLAAACTLELGPPADAEHELACAPSIALELRQYEGKNKLL